LTIRRISLVPTASMASVLGLRCSVGVITGTMLVSY
jgi:hypothetical protein